MRNLFKKILPLLWLLVAVQGASQWFRPSVIPTVVWWIVDILLLLEFADDYFRSPRSGILWVRIFLLWVLVEAIRGLILSEGYWDYKALCENLFVFLLPLCAIRYGRTDTLKSDCWLLLLLIVPLFFLLQWNMTTEGVGRFFFIITFFLLFLPRINPVHRLFLYLILALIVLFSSLESRAMTLRIVCGLLLSLTLLNPSLLRLRSWFRVVGVLFLLTPIVLIILAQLNLFNVFDLMERNEGKYIVVVDDSENDHPKGYSDLMDDTRTFIYEETINSAVRSGYAIWGHSLARGYRSETFGWSTDQTSGYRRERNNGEVGVLNVFTHMGLVGVILYFLLFATAGMTAINKANSPQMMVLGLWVCFRWLLSWLEEFTMFDLNNVLLWVEIGMCCSPAFLSMNRAAFSSFLNNCFPLNRFLRVDPRINRFRSLTH